MSFVHGHSRDATWVMSHLRAPNHAEEGQLELPVEEVQIPTPRPAADDADPETSPSTP